MCVWEYVSLQGFKFSDINDFGLYNSMESMPDQVNELVCESEFEQQLNLNLNICAEVGLDVI